VNPFSHAYYRSMLEQCLAAGYRISSFADYDPSAERTIILRHDIDYTMDGVLAFASIEKALDCTATYLLRVHADEYNVFACTTWRVIDQVRRFGHELGLHFEVMNAGRALGLDPLELFRRERAVLEAVLGQQIQTVSEHRELSGTIHGTPLFEERYDHGNLGVEHYAMAPEYTRDMKYLSDSNAHWREGDLLQHIGEQPRIQALIHPDWWFEDDLLLKGPYYHPRSTHR
jgi:hypothetical protein